MTEITLPLPPNRANARGHWAVNKHKQTEYQTACVPAIYAAFGPFVPMAEPRYQKVRISMAFYVHQLNDWDNLVSRSKWAWDALVQCGIIPDDSPKYVDLGDVTQTVDRKNQRLVLRIEKSK